MKPRQRTTWHSLRRRLLSLLVLAGVCASVLPIPLPSSSSQPAEKDRSQPFPCQDRPCGCRSAEQCWQKCCCFTNAQKVAWAKAHRVSAPDYVHVAAAREAKSAVCSKPCCSSKPKSDSGQSRALVDLAKNRETPAPPAVKVDPDKPVDYVLGFVAEQCRGESSFWNSLPWVVLPDVVTLNISKIVPGFENPESATLPQITDQPPAPPPRRAISFSVI